MNDTIKLAKLIAPVNIADATRILMSIGISLNDAARFLYAHMRANRVMA